jgi:hypothetical protein
LEYEENRNDQQRQYQGRPTTPRGFLPNQQPVSAFVDDKEIAYEQRHSCQICMYPATR